MLGPQRDPYRQRFLDCQAELMWRMQRDGREDDPGNYLDAVRRRLGLGPATIGQ